MIALGLDVSKLSTGFAIMDLDDMTIIKTGYIKNPSDQPLGAFLVRLRNHIIHLCHKNDVNVIIMEDLHMRFISVAKQILQIHGVVKEVGRNCMGAENTTYASQTWRHKILNIPKFKKVEKDALALQARNKTHLKELTSIKQKVIEYVNNRMDTSYTFKENDIVDAIGLCLAYSDENVKVV